MTVLLTGDVMGGRGVDQVLPAPCAPVLHEPSIRSAEAYVALAERASGPVPRPVEGAHPWGDALGILEREAPDARIVNLETSATRSAAADPAKGIHYRMSPENARALLGAARIDACALANNHVLDWGRAGLEETLATLDAAGVAHAGAGRTLAEAEAPAVLPLARSDPACPDPAGRRLLLFAFGTPSSGIPAAWAATPERSGLAVIDEASETDRRRVEAAVARFRRPGDRVVVSIHWGGNWGYAVPRAQRALAHALVDAGTADVVHGHSSHHVKAIEVRAGRLVLYGCGDLLNDYEGITGMESYRGELGALYLATLDAETGALVRLRLAPTRVRRLRLERAGEADVAWLAETLTREGEPLGTRVEASPEGALELRWAEPRRRAGAGALAS